VQDLGTSPKWHQDSKLQKKVRANSTAEENLFGTRRMIMAVPFSANCRSMEGFLWRPEEGDTKNS